MNGKKRWTTGGLLPAILLVAGISSGIWAQSGIVVTTKMGEFPYGDGNFEEKLAYNLAEITSVPVTLLDRDEVNMPQTGEVNELKALLDYGTAQKARFMVEIQIDRVDLKKKKATIFPILVFRYKVFAVMTGKIRALDVARERVVSSDKFEFDLKASDQWQVTEDDPDNPSLLIASDEKLHLFDRLGEAAAEDIAGRIKNLVRGNNFGK